VAINIAWPRKAVYDALSAAGHGHWYWQYIAILFIGGVVIIGSIYYFAVYNKKPIEVLREHAAEVPSMPEIGEPAMGEMAP
jgi:hypothetical protein